MLIASRTRSAWFFASAVALALAACSDVPDTPTANNPFDPAGDNPGSGYQLSAVVTGDSVTLSWPDRDVLSWVVRHSSTTDDFTQMADISVTNVVSRVGGTATLVHKGMVRESVNYYAVRGAGMVAGVPVALDIPALFSAAGGIRNVATRTVQLEVRTGVAEQVEVANTPDFTGATLFDVVAAQRTLLPWTLGFASAAGETLRVYGRTRTGSSSGPVRQVRFTANFNPALSPVAGQRIAPTGLVVVDTVVVLQATGDGIVDLVLRQNGDETVIDDPSAAFELTVPASTSSALQWTADFGGDFGYRVPRTITLTPATQIGVASLSVVGGAQTTTQRSIRLLATAAGAGQVIVSEDAGFTDAAWVAFADTLDFELSEGFGQKTIFAAFRNPFVVDRPVASVAITYVVPPARGSERAVRGAGDPSVERPR